MLDLHIIGVVERDELVNPLSVNNELTEIGENYSFIEVGNNLRMPYGIARVAVEVERTI